MVKEITASLGHFQVLFQQELGTSVGQKTVLDVYEYVRLFFFKQQPLSFALHLRSERDGVLVPVKTAE